MKLILTPALLFLALAACGEPARPIRTPCEASPLLLRDVWSLTCARGFPPSPLSNDPQYWQGEQPCKKTVVYDDAEAPWRQERYDYSKPYSWDGATYDEEGNIVAFDAHVFGVEGRATYHYEYGRLIGASSGGHAYAIEYDDDRRSLERSQDRASSSYHYVYDDSGRLITEGTPYIDALFSYHYNADDRLEMIVAGAPPGLHSTQYDYSYDDRGRLAAVRFNGSPDSRDPLWGAQTWTYFYDCAP